MSIRSTLWLGKQGDPTAREKVSLGINYREQGTMTCPWSRKFFGSFYFGRNFLIKPRSNHSFLVCWKIYWV